jgi:hypothetical protein
MRIHASRALAAAAALATVSVQAGPPDEPLVVPVHRLEAAPALDGDAREWPPGLAVPVPLAKSIPGADTATAQVLITAGRHAGRFYLLARWADTTEDRLHKPWLWNDDLQRYVRGPQREDRFALQFAIEGDYDTNWLSGRSFVADMWHWKASRSDPHGLAHD